MNTKITSTLFIIFLYFLQSSIALSYKLPKGRVHHVPLDSIAAGHTNQINQGETMVLMLPEDSKIKLPLDKTSNYIKNIEKCGITQLCPSKCTGDAEVEAIRHRRPYCIAIQGIEASIVNFELQSKDGQGKFSITIRKPVPMLNVMNVPDATWDSVHNLFVECKSIKDCKNCLFNANMQIYCIECNSKFKMIENGFKCAPCISEGCDKCQDLEIVGKDGEAKVAESCEKCEESYRLFKTGFKDGLLGYCVSK